MRKYLKFFRLFLDFGSVFLLWASNLGSDGVSRRFAKALIASKIQVKIYHGLWQWVVVKKVVSLFFISSRTSFFLDHLLSIKHVNRAPFKFVPDPFLAGALSFTVPSTYITSESGC